MPEVIDFRVRLPLELRPSAELPSDYLEQYDRVLDLSANRHRTLADLVADMSASGVTHAVVHAEYEYGDMADKLSLLSEQVLHGTDWPVFPMERALAEWRSGGLREHVLEAITGGNAARLLGRSGG